MDYNSQSELLVIAEYGRNIQNLINYAKSIEDDELRQKFVERIIDLMQQMHPYNKNIAEYREKLWKHVFHIADYDLKVLPDNGIIPEQAEEKKKPEVLSYPEHETRFRHYGHNVQTLIKKAIEMEDGPKKKEFVKVLASYMKLAYRTWNAEHYVNDETIKSDLELLSDGKVKVDDDISIDYLSKGSPKRRKTNTKQHGRGRSNGRRHRKRK